MIIGIDFDGTCVTHDYPFIGEDIGAVPILKKLIEADHKLILITMRGNNKDGNFLDYAVRWFKKNGIKLSGINENPYQHTWTNSPKIYANLYIDDAALGIPLKYDSYSPRPYVNWIEVEKLLIEKRIL